MKKVGVFWLVLLHSSVLLAVPVSERVMLDVGDNEVGDFGAK